MTELEKAKPEVEIELAGKPYRLKFDFWALSLVDEEITLGFFSSGERWSLHKLIVLVWAGLLHAHPEFEGRSDKERRDAMRQVAELVSKSKLEDVYAKVAEALGASFPAAKEGEAKKEEPE